MGTVGVAGGGDLGVFVGASVLVGSSAQVVTRRHMPTALQWLANLARSILCVE